MLDFLLLGLTRKDRLEKEGPEDKEKNEDFEENKYP